MNYPVDVSVLRDDANDQDATLVAVLRESGSLVTAGEHIFDIETSKATQEVYAPAAGVLEHALRVGDTVQFAVPFARIASPDARSDKPAPLPEVTQEATSIAASNASRGTRTSSPRMSARARELAAAHGFGPDDFDEDLVTVDDVQRRIQSMGTTAAGKAAPAPATQNKPSQPVRDIASLKRDEIHILSRGAGNTMLSVVGIAVGMISPIRPESGFFSDKILDLVVFEASRLMGKYPQFNAAFEPNGIRTKSEINAGVALDDGKGLVVYGIEQSAGKGLAEIQDEILAGIVKYAEGRLTVLELTRATFIITDLSAMELDFVFPILPSGHSGILGITRSSRLGYSLFLGFDHRVTEGRVAALFLGELRDRLVSFSATTTGSLQCSFCEKALDREVNTLKGQGLMRVIDRNGQDALCCYSCWTGW